MLLMISILMGVIPLIGIAWILAEKSITTVDGLFMSLILLTLSGIFFLNALLEMDARGWLKFLHKQKTAAAKEPPSAKAV